MSAKTEIKNAIIESARITTGESGFLDVWIQLDFGAVGQGFGGYALYLPKSFANHKLQSVAGHHIFRIMEVAGVETWDAVKGKSIRARCNWSRIEAIGHIVKDDWFCPEQDYKGLTGTDEKTHQAK